MDRWERLETKAFYDKHLRFVHSMFNPGMGAFKGN
jgi:hypothetical protein